LNFSDQFCDSNTPTYSCITGWTGDPNNITSDPNFINCCLFIDKTTGPNSFNTIKVPDANRYDVNDIIEYDNDSIARLVTDVNTQTNIITFIPQRAFTSESNITIYNWGPGINNVHEDYHIDPSSPCVDAGNPKTSTAPYETDIDGEARVMNGNHDANSVVDIGADESYWSLADYNRDEIVNFLDYAGLAGAWQTDDPNISLDDDNDVDIYDLALFCDDWLWQLDASQDQAAYYYSTGYQQPLLLPEQASRPAVAQIKVDVNDLLNWWDSLWENNELPDWTYKQYLGFRQSIELPAEE
jgi:hypothetical protein